MTLFLCVCSFVLSSCSKTNSESGTDSQQRLTLYTSVDDEFARMVVAQFEAETGIRVDILGDTEATKTTGLVTRLQSEKGSPTCDVWWSSEPMGTILLANDGVLETGGMLGAVDQSWPPQLRANDWTWVGTALRKRVIVYAPDRVRVPPVSMHDLIQPEYKNRVGMARPQFGTTRIHMALLASWWTPSVLEDWLIALQENNVRLYDGNSTVVRGVAMGEIDIGLTDTDDVWSGQRNDWDVDFAMKHESQTDVAPLSRFDVSVQQVMIPNTIAIIKDAPHPELAKKLAAYLVSPDVERLLYESTSGNHPVNAALRAELNLSPIVTNYGPGPIYIPDYEQASEFVDEAMDLCDRILGP